MPVRRRGLSRERLGDAFRTEKKRDTFLRAGRSLERNDLLFLYVNLMILKNRKRIKRINHSKYFFLLGKYRTEIIGATFLALFICFCTNLGPHNGIYLTYLPIALTV